MTKGLTFGLSVALFALTTGMAMAQDDGSTDAGAGGDDEWVVIDPIETGGEDIVVDDGVVYEDPAAGGEGLPDVLADEGGVPPESECGGCEYWTMADGPIMENARDETGSSGRFESDWEPFAQRPARPDFCEVTQMDLGWLCPDNRQ